ncbi:C4-dicarboxylate ABC transporter permease [Microbulbifer flavimaris]|uniref:TRAP transporter small permease protein n=1 Tax=Microbulbifer flavimaris TaxID=1781068 RepID=A0ABX4I1D8_9GAMM|nr:MULTISPECIES: TRAP transporter small permease subunit [Microbulbifer]KUJ83968.1 C4-dicarboxylate ABC transporter permease [Microbulbifer sp. ZGT114]PCO06146.1 C4-dicarboxylate ABC transporter permease [Microbulbifer flavimaris]
MPPLVRLARQIDRLATATGSLLGWFTLAMVLLQSAVVLLRYGFDGGSVALQDAVLYLHGAVLMLGLAYALHTDAHVRVDVFYRRMSARSRAWVNAVGTLVFLLPLCAFIILGSWHFTTASWAVRESSSSAGGLPGIFLLKTLIPLSALTLGLQGIAQLCRSLTELMLVETTPPAPRAPTDEPRARAVEEVSA